MKKVIIQGYPNYSITPTGDIINNKTEKIRKPRNNGLGYLQVDLYANGKGKNFYIHKLVAQHFLGATAEDEINHMDGDKANCKYTNLEITTHRENIKHAEDTKLLLRNSLGQFSSISDESPNG